MSRTQANIYLTLWTDPDFRTLSTNAQWLYFTMLTHQTLNYCGVMDWRPARLAAMNADMTVQDVQHAAWELGQKRLIAVDPDTEEALVRSFVRHDGVLKSPNVTKGLVRQFGGIGSLKIMELVAREVRRAGEENPEWKGLEQAKPVSKQFPEPFRKGFVYVPDWFKNSSETVQFSDPQKIGNPSESVPPTSTSTSTSSKEESGAAKARADIQEICNHLADRIEANGSKRPRIGKTWTNEARLLIDNDKRTVRDIKQVIDWSQKDSFWKTNIMSMTALRKHFDRLRLQRLDERGSGSSQPRVIMADDLQVY